MASKAQLQQELSQLKEEFDALFDDHELLKEEVNVLRLDIRRLFKKWQKDHELIRQPSAAEKLAHEVLELRKDMLIMRTAPIVEEETYRSEYRKEAQHRVQNNRDSEPAQSVQAKPRTERKPSLQERYEGLRKVPWRREADTIIRPEISPRRRRERTRSARTKKT